MKPHPRRFLITSLIALSVIVAAGLSQAAESTGTRTKPVLLYSLYFNAKGENRYAPDGAYKDVLQKLGLNFDVRVSDERLNGKTLKGVSLVLIANPNDKAFGTNPPPPHMARSDVRNLTRFVKLGGGLILMENQEGHNLEVTDSNRLLAQFGMEATNLYTDAKLLTLPKTTPIIGGLHWGYYTGNLLLLNPNHPAQPRALVTNDLSQKPERGTRDQAGVLLATAELGKGRVVVCTDSGWIANWALNDQGVGGTALKGQDNWEIFDRLALWAAHLE